LWNEMQRGRMRWSAERMMEDKPIFPWGGETDRQSPDGQDTAEDQTSMREQ
jgi:hypothetical protein